MQLSLAAVMIVEEYDRVDSLASDFLTANSKRHNSFCILRVLCCKDDLNASYLSTAMAASALIQRYHDLDFVPGPSFHFLKVYTDKAAMCRLAQLTEIGSSD